MAAETVLGSQTDEYEQELLRILRSLPPNRVAEVIDFAAFLKSRIADEVQDEDETVEEIRASEEKWDALFATEESQRLLGKMADEVRAEIRAGRTRPMIFTEDGEIAPG